MSVCNLEYKYNTKMINTEVQVCTTEITYLSNLIHPHLLLQSFSCSNMIFFISPFFWVNLIRSKLPENLKRSTGSTGGRPILLSSKQCNFDLKTVIVITEHGVRRGVQPRNQWVRNSKCLDIYFLWWAQAPSTLTPLNTNGVNQQKVSHANFPHSQIS